MKILKQMILKKLSKCDEATFNKKFPIYSRYGMITMCAVYLGEKIPDANVTNFYFSKYHHYKKIGDVKRIRESILKLKSQMLKDQIIISKFQDAVKDIDVEDVNRPEIWTIDSVGILASDSDF